MDVNLVFSGGGIKGIAYIGVLEALEEWKITYKKIAGTSVGSIFGALIAAGYTARELKDIMFQTDFGLIFGLEKKQYLEKAKNLFIQKGIKDPISIYNFVYSLLAKKKVFSFQDLKKVELQIITVDMTNKRLVVLPDDLPKYGINPNTFSIAYACMMSSAIPFYFKPVILNNQKFVDGGVLSNFPIWIFKNLNSPCLGFKTVKEQAMGNLIYKNHNCYITEIAVSNISATNFKLTAFEKESLVLAGYYTTKNNLQKIRF